MEGTCGAHHAPHDGVHHNVVRVLGAGVADVVAVDRADLHAVPADVLQQARLHGAVLAPCTQNKRRVHSANDVRAAEATSTKAVQEGLS